MQLAHAEVFGDENKCIELLSKILVKQINIRGTGWILREWSALEISFSP